MAVLAYFGFCVRLETVAVFSSDTNVKRDCNRVVSTKRTADSNAIGTICAEEVNDSAIAADNVLNRPSIVTADRSDQPLSNLFMLQSFENFA
ncbi:hypothetical protein [Paenibacillus sp. Leaf72]|uniref:hypothetical protein n=1 Tax=Paenibacillus sp. Leaf72 TaxID=1736234 RepID=UPI0006F3C9ED|nr:hypothetical protein [Paenibacillus sp. Leaf72]KQO18498.1 hypothetical protein ASF12_07805 [Paenibacillus sp. Leaf72]